MNISNDTTHNAHISICVLYRILSLDIIDLYYVKFLQLFELETHLSCIYLSFISIFREGF
jgi:hypothetical protein